MTDDGTTQWFGTFYNVCTFSYLWTKRSEQKDKVHAKRTHTDLSHGDTDMYHPLQLHDPCRHSDYVYFNGQITVLTLLQNRNVKTLMRLGLFTWSIVIMVIYCTRTDTCRIPRGFENTHRVHITIIIGKSMAR